MPTPEQTHLGCFNLLIELTVIPTPRNPPVRGGVCVCFNLLIELTVIPTELQDCIEAGYTSFNLLIELTVIPTGASSHTYRGMELLFQSPHRAYGHSDFLRPTMRQLPH